MVSVSNILTGFLNFITLVISIPMVAIMLWLKANHTSEGASLNLLYFPFLILGLFIMVISLLGLFGSCCRITFFLWIYLFVMFLLIVGLACFLVFGFVVTNKGVGEAISGKGFMEYRLGNYSGWLQDQVVDSKNWREFVVFFQAGEICSASNIGHLLDNPVPYMKQLSPIQSGCCKPPMDCGYIFKNSTYWEVPKFGLSSEEKDCKIWSNNQEKLCYDCDSCKAGTLQYIKNEWKKMAIYLGCFLGFFVIVYSIGCCALRNNRADKYQRYRGAYR